MVGQKEFTFESEGGHGPYVPTHDTEREVHLVTTASPPNFPHHRPLFEGFLLHEALLMKDFRGDQQFFAEDGAMAGYPTTPAPGSRYRGDASTRVVPHEDAPAYSDIATTSATMAATLPMTTPAAVTMEPPVSMAHALAAEHRGRVSEMEVAVTTDSLTTPVMLTSDPPPQRDGPALTMPLRDGPPVQDTVTMATSLAPQALTTSTRQGKEEARVPDATHNPDLGSEVTTTASSTSSSGDVDEETTTTTIITTTIITTMQMPGMYSTAELLAQIYTCLKV